MPDLLFNVQHFYFILCPTVYRLNICVVLNAFCPEHENACCWWFFFADAMLPLLWYWILLVNMCFTTVGITAIIMLKPSVMWRNSLKCNVANQFRYTFNRVIEFSDQSEKRLCIFLFFGIKNKTIPIWLLPNWIFHCCDRFCGCANYY